jgi:molybdopterin-guanine dinucleotide biosynthesis protein A
MIIHEFPRKKNNPRAAAHQCYYSLMRRAGFVLAGGASSRMGRDKALLPARGATLLEQVAREVLAATGSVTVIAPSGRYSGLGLHVIPDLTPGQGPLGGIHTALSVTDATWNLIVACDMPDITAPFLEELLAQAEASGADCLIPRDAAGRQEPLCAVYHRRCLAAIAAAIGAGIRKVTDGLDGLHAAEWRPATFESFTNLNTPQDWSDHNA